MRAPGRVAGALPSFGPGGRGRPEGARQLFEPRQLVQLPESQDLQELRRGAVQQRAAQSLAARHDLHETALDQLVDHGARIDAPDLVHLEPAHRLAVGDGGERLEGRRGEAARAQRELRAVDRSGVLARRQELPPLRDLYKFLAVTSSRVRLPHLAQRRPDRALTCLRVERAQLVHGERARRGEQGRLKQLRERAHGRITMGPNAPSWWTLSAPRLASSSSAMKAESTSTTVARAPTTSRHASCSRPASSASIFAVAPSTSSGRGTTRCSIGSGIRAITRSAAASSSFSSITSGAGGAAAGSGAKPRPDSSAPPTAAFCIQSTSSRICWYSSSRRTSSARGSSHPSSPARRGSNSSALMRTSRAAISR